MDMAAESIPDYGCVDAAAYAGEPASIWTAEDPAASRLRLLRGHIGGASVTHGAADGAMHPVAADAALRLSDMAMDGIDAAMVFPARWLRPPAERITAAACRVTNRWVADYRSLAPRRLHGVAILPAHAPADAAAELAFAHDMLGLRAASLRAGPGFRPLECEPLWRVAEERGLAVVLHDEPGAGRLAPNGPWPPPVPSRALRGVCAEMLAVCARHAGLRVGILESGGGWVVPWLRQMDALHDAGGLRELELPDRPGAIFLRQFWIAADPAEGRVQTLVEYLGADRLLWTSGTPRPLGGAPGAAGMMRQVLAGMPPRVAAQVLAAGARAFYGLG